MDNFQIKTAQNITIEQNVAHITTRIGSFLLDYLIIAAYVILLIFIMSWLDYEPSMEQWAVSLLFSLPILFYSLVFEILLNGQTPGKWANKIRVVKLDGSKPSLGSYLLRWLFRIIDITITSGSLAVLTILLNGKGQRLGDIAAGTTVISEKKRISLKNTLISEVPENYKPTFPQVTMLSDKDIQTIKQLYNSSIKRREYKIIQKLYIKVIEITGIKTDLKPVDFIKIVIDDYNYYTQQ